MLTFSEPRNLRSGSIVRGRDILNRSKPTSCRFPGVPGSSGRTSNCESLAPGTAPKTPGVPRSATLLYKVDGVPNMYSQSAQIQMQQMQDAVLFDPLLQDTPIVVQGCSAISCSLTFREDPTILDS